MSVDKITLAKLLMARKFGIELEVSAHIPKSTIAKYIQAVDDNHDVHISEHYQTDENNDFWHVKFDRSCTDDDYEYGFEVSTFVASKLADLKMIGTVANHLRERSVQVNDNCALHVHSQINDYAPKDLAKMLAWWLKLEPYWLSLVPSRRYKGKFSKPLRDHHKDFLSKINISNVPWEDLYTHCTKKPKDGWRKSDRRLAINIMNHIKFSNKESSKNTVELRLPESSLDYDDVVCWTALFSTFLDKVKKADYPKNLVTEDMNEFFNFLGLDGSNEVLDKNLYDLKIWILKRMKSYFSKQVLLHEAAKMLRKVYPNFVLDTI